MKTKLLIFFALIISLSIKAQEYTTLNEIDSGLNNPNQVRVTDDILYVATETQILSYDIAQENPVANVVFTTPTLAGDELAIITTFNIRNGYLFIAVEVIDTVKDIFVENRVVRVSLSNTSDISLIETLSSYVSAVTFDGSLLYRVTEDDDTGLSIISYRDVDVLGSTMTTLTTFDGIARDIDTFDNLVIISKRNGSIEAVNINDTTPILAPLNLGTTISTASGIHVLDNDGTILIAGGNKIYEGDIINEDFNLDLFNLIENTTYSSEGNNNSFNDVFVYEGFAYMTIADSGVVVKTDKLASSDSCDNSGTVLNEFITNKTYLSDVFIDGNYLYICQFLEGITRVDLNDNSQTNIYTPTKVGQNQEVLYELFVNNNKLYFTSKDFDVDTFEITSSYLKEIDLSNIAYNVTTLASSSLNTEIISSIAYSNDKIIYGVIDETEDSTFELYTYNTLNNNITNTGLDGNGELGKMIVNGNNLYYLDYGHGILKADVNALSNSPTSFLNANDNNYYPINFYIDNDVLYFSNGQEINKVSLLSTVPETEVVNVVTNGNIIESNGYGTTTCGYFEGGLSIKDNTVYATIANANSIINFSAGSLSNGIITTVPEDKSFYIENDKLYFKNNNSKGFIYNGLGLQVKTVDSSKYNYIDLSDLVSGIYIIKVNNESLKIIL